MAAVLGALLGGVVAFTTGGHGYDATAEVLVRPNAVDATFFQNDTESLLDTEVAIVRSSEILTAAAKTVPGIDPGGLATSLAVEPDARHSTLRISVLADSPELSRNLTNAVASTYLASVQTRPDVVRRSTVSVLHEATTAVKADRPNAPLYILIGGLLAGVAIALATVVWKMLDPRLLDPDGLEVATGRPLVGKIPSSRLEHGRLEMISRPDSPAADAYRSLVSKIPFFALEEGVRCVAVTGSSSEGEPAEHHSDVASNLAIACANSGIRTMLVSGDLRHEAFLARQLRPDSPGLTDLILARAPWRDSETWRSRSHGQLATGDVVYLTSISNLAFVPTGRTAPNPGDLLSSRAAGVALSHLKHLCDLVILDTPTFANPETANIVRYAETVIAVVSRGSTRKAALRALAASTQLQGVPLYFVLKESTHRRARQGKQTSASSTDVPPQSAVERASSYLAAAAANPVMTEATVSARTPTADPESVSTSTAATPSAPEPPAWWSPPVPSPPPPPPPPPAPPAPPVHPVTAPEATVQKPAPQIRMKAWRQVRLATRRTEWAVRKQSREERERKKPPPRGKQY